MQGHEFKTIRKTWVCRINICRSHTGTSRLKLHLYRYQYTCKYMTILEPTQPSQDVSVPIHGKCYFVHPGRRGRNFPCWQAPRVLPGTLSPALLTLLLFCNERKKDTRPDCPASRRRLHKVGFSSQFYAAAYSLLLGILQGYRYSLLLFCTA